MTAVQRSDDDDDDVVVVERALDRWWEGETADHRTAAGRESARAVMRAFLDDGRRPGGGRPC